MLNVAVVMGRLAADPELRHTSSGLAVTSFTLAVDRGYVKQGQERQTDWIDVVASDCRIHLQVLYQRSDDGCAR